MTLNVEVKGLAELRQAMTSFSDRRMNAAIATALSRTAVQMRDKLKVEMSRSIDRPTPYTLNSMFAKTARADRLLASVYFKDDTTNGGTPATRYMLPLVQGGQRRTKRLEVALQAAGALPDGWLVVPGAGARIDRFGNVERGQIIQVLSQLRIQLVAGSSRNMSFDAGKKIAAQRKAGGRFFVVPPGGKAAPGIYQRELFGRNVVPVFIFVRGAAYRRRFDFYGIGQALADVVLPQEIERAVREHIERMARAPR